MKKTVLMLTTTLMISAGIASAGPGNRPDFETRLSRMQEHLQLSDEQVEQMREIHAQGGGREEIRSVLTEEQRTMAKKHREQMRKQHKHRKHGESESDS